MGQAAAQAQVGLGEPDPLADLALLRGTTQFQRAVRPELPAASGGLPGGGGKEDLTLRQEGQGGDGAPRRGDPQASWGLTAGWGQIVDLEFTPLRIVPGVLVLGGVDGSELAAKGNPLPRAGAQERLDGGGRKITQGTQGPGKGQPVPSSQSVL